MLNIIRILVLGATAAMSSGYAASLAESGDAAADKRRLVAEYLELTASEAAAFWPLYERLQREWQGLQRQREEHIRNFGRDYSQMTDALALEYTREHLRHEETRLSLLRAYLPRFEKVMPARKLARYYQIEDKIHAVISAETATEIPLLR